MARIPRDRPSPPSYALVVEGETELWYFKMLQRNERKLPIAIRPELPIKKSIEDQFNQVIELSEKEYDRVFWVIDLDTILQQSKSSKSNPTPFDTLKSLISKIKKDHPKISVIINNPCLEFWFLLHFVKTSRQFRSCEEVGTELKKHIKDYDKSQKYFTKEGSDIYIRLKPHLKTAIKNAKELGLSDTSDPEKSISELFTFFESNELKTVVT